MRGGINPAARLMAAGSWGLNFNPTEFARPNEAHAIARIKRKTITGPKYFLSS